MPANIRTNVHIDGPAARDGEPAIITARVCTLPTSDPFVVIDVDGLSIYATEVATLDRLAAVITTARDGLAALEVPA